MITQKNLITKVVAVDNKLRGGRKLNTNAIELNLFKNIKNDYILYTFCVDIPVIWQHITNGEKVLIQPHTSRKLNTNHIELKSSNPVHLPLNPMGFELNT